MRNARVAGLAVSLALGLGWSSPAPADQDGTHIATEIDGRGTVAQTGGPGPLDEGSLNCVSTIYTGTDCTAPVLEAWFGSAAKTVFVAATAAADSRFLGWSISGPSQFMHTCTDPSATTCELRIVATDNSSEYHYVLRARFRDTKPGDTFISGFTVDSAAGRGTFQFTSSKPSGAAYRCSIDGGAFAACGSPSTTAPLAPGDHSFAVQSVDRFGNIDTSPATQAFTVADVKPPSVALTAPAAGSGFGPGAAIPLAANVADDDLARVRVEFLVDGARVAEDAAGADGFTASVPADALTDGVHQVVGRAIDTGGSADSAPVAITMTRPLPFVPTDADHDGVTGTRDCDDSNAAIRPGATDVPGDDVDQDCSGADAQAPRIQSPVSSGWYSERQWSRATLLTLKDVPAGATIELACKGKGCPFKTRRTAVPTARKAVTLLPQLKRAKLRVGTALELRITKSGWAGKYMKFTVRRRKVPRVTSKCLPPSGGAPISC